MLALHGKLSQPKRTAIYYSFKTTKHCVLFATDLAARGLDFPGVDYPYDRSETFDLRLDTARLSVDESVMRILDTMAERGFLRG